jgi:hypothetical protein
MATNAWIKGFFGIFVGCGLVLGASPARADDATVTVGNPQRFAEPPPDHQSSQSGPIAVDDQRFDDRLRDREIHRSPFRLSLGPMGVTTGKGFGVGVGTAAELGTGSVGGRLTAAWLRGEGKKDDGTSTPTGDMISQYGGEVTLDVHRRGPVHPVIGMGAALLYVSRPDTSGFAGAGTGRFALEYSLGLEDADVRVGGSVLGGLVGPVDRDIKDLRAYAMVGAHLAIGF